MVMFRVIFSAIVGGVSGGGAGIALAILFLSTPLERVLGPRYSEFDVFGLFFVAVVAALIASAASFISAIYAVSATNGREWLRSTIQSRYWVTVVLVPTVLFAVLALAVNGEWAWLGLIHLSACLGILAGMGSALILPQPLGGGASGLPPEACPGPPPDPWVPPTAEEIARVVRGRGGASTPPGPTP
jgi:hypothetical protein